MAIFFTQGHERDSGGGEGHFTRCQRAKNPVKAITSQAYLVHRSTRLVVCNTNERGQAIAISTALHRYRRSRGDWSGEGGGGGPGSKSLTRP